MHPWMWMTHEELQLRRVVKESQAELEQQQIKLREKLVAAAYPSSCPMFIHRLAVREAPSAVAFRA